MVFIEDSGAVFDAPIEKVWRLVEAHSYDASKIHPGTRNHTGEVVGENTVTSSWDADMDGQKIRFKVRITTFPLLRMAFEFLEGPMTGSKFFNFYIPNGSHTGVTVVGDFKSAVVPEDKLRPTVLAFLEQAFREDSAYLETMK